MSRHYINEAHPSLLPSYFPSDKMGGKMLKAFNELHLHFGHLAAAVLQSHLQSVHSTKVGETTTISIQNMITSLTFDS